MSDTRYTRICWNTNGWQRPTGDAPKIETQSYVKTNGFGHEEWLFNFGWTIGEYKYGFIQGFNTKNQIYQNSIFDVILYTISPARMRYFVGTVKNCNVLSKDEVEEASKIYKKEGWLDEMVGDVKRVDGEHKLLLSERNPLFLLNVKFKFDEVEIFEPFVEIPRKHRLQRYNRYKPIEAKEVFIDDFPFSQSPQRYNFRSGRIKNTLQGVRTAQPEVEFDPAHNRLQNALLLYLIDVYGRENVGYEVSHIDLAVKDSGGLILYEIKTEPTAKRCIRLAIGQLLEYAHWSNENAVKELIIVGKVLPSAQDKTYLKLLRKRYNFPVYYQRFDTATNHLSDKY